MARTTGKHPAVRGTTGKQRAVTSDSLRTLLVVDDEPEVARLIGKIFERRGYRIVVAGDGHEALARALAELPDVVLLDVNLPGIDGFEVCRRLKADARTRGIPVVILSANESVDEASRALALGAEEYLVKPFVREVIVHNVERILARR